MLQSSNTRFSTGNFSVTLLRPEVTMRHDDSGRVSAVTADSEVS